jgi:hypothetical protein
MAITVVSKEKIFKNRPIRNKNYLWRPCLLMDRNKMSNLYKGPSIDASNGTKSPKQQPNCLKRTATTIFLIVFSSPCQRQCELLPSLGVRRPLTFHILILQFQRRRFLKIGQSETRIAYGSHVC